MSIIRNDCEHGHGADVLQLAAEIGQAHGIDVQSAVLVVMGRAGETPFVVGQFNTTALAVAGHAVLLQGAEHKPDGCIMCDAAGQACTAAAQVLHDSFRERERARTMQ